MSDLLRHASGELPLDDGTLVMGIVNVTPDSFSDGYPDRAEAVEHGQRLADEGADILDVGGESTRPGADPVPADEEIARTAPVIEALASKTGLPVSIDTTKAAVARATLDAGASIVNDISAGTADPAMLALVAERKAAVCLMHMQGTPQTMQQDPHYEDVVEEVAAYLESRAAAAMAAGIPAESIVLDPGIGFGKLVDHNLSLLNDLGRIADLGYPVLVGTSRKSFIGKVLDDLPVDQRLEGTAATVAISIMNGASIVRVHDVRAMVRVVRMTDAVIWG